MQLTAQELRGKKLFDNPAGSNCASCHIDQPGVDNSHPLFTGFNFQALGVRRNTELRANADPNYFDMGLCGPLRTDQSSDKNTPKHRPARFGQTNFGQRYNARILFLLRPPP